MARKSKRQAAELHRAFLAAIRAGRTTRGQFAAWHAQRRSASRGLVITLREAKPVSASGTGRRSSRRSARWG